MGRKGGTLALIGSVTATQLSRAAAWGNKNKNAGDAVYYSNSVNEWSQASHIAMEVLGCSWADTDYSEDVGCLADESGDGTQYWYQMANCKRAQVAYSVYASSSGKTSCGSSDYVGTYVTQYGLPEFSYMLATYDGNANLYTDDLPMCEQGDNGLYLATGCGTDGSFTIDSFSDSYCLAREGYYGSLDSINKAMKNLKSCYTIHDSSSGYSFDYSLAGALIQESNTCSAQDDSICPDNNRVSMASSGKNFVASKAHGLANINVANKAKYALGTLCLIGSLFMFLGILFTNRRKRRAMMHRKMRASRARRSGSKSRAGSTRSKSSGRTSSSRSKSRGRTSGSSSRREGSGRSKSRSKKVDDGVFA
mmetsp:Transcript_7033/g.10254  ORF Transcript_7033/g.10254 Transcript_7033/m.10254 type:complete len:364 (-) Transcript_7033:206-1297(-)|eukprot:CAMPEP_0201687766 /NCGR_PEP_ID=MMETSP0578-20130828/1676_1 /ASSEMBLY_ACC=CAM_ASM_000663 /TAXON_ID=267565 /ORGANISM="Skeletonema grethea, Strain CCMP 1804" /LENGTH=363 /DNA_ID=CAMNT_0048171941 /DNA_START=120 /DNA_END=1211 /DNA_ORIENTATION=-